MRALDVLDSDPEAALDALVRVASIVCGTPIPLISLVDAERQSFKANIGLPGATETPRDVAFCAHEILDEQIFEVPDVALDPRFADNPLVPHGPGIRFYAGAPVQLSDGSRVGTLCVIDSTPHQLTPRSATCCPAWPRRPRRRWRAVTRSAAPVNWLTRWPNSMNCFE